MNALQELRCLFLQRNCLSKIENLEGLNALVQLDLSENHISVVEGLSHLPNLTTLNLCNNYLNDLASISHLIDCKELSSLDLSKNQLVGEDIIDCLSGITNMKSLNIESNPVADKTAYFRKKVIVACKSLRYLDRPVFDDERMTAEAFALGGIDAERQTKDSLQQAKRNKDRETLTEFRAWQESVRNRPVAEPVTVVEETRVSPDDLIIPDDYSLDDVDEQYQSDPEDLQATSLVKKDVSEKLTLLHDIEKHAQLEVAEATSFVESKVHEIEPVFAEAALETYNVNAAAETNDDEKSEVTPTANTVSEIPHLAEVTSIDVTPFVPVVEVIPAVIQTDDEAKILRDSIEQFRINNGTQHSGAIMAWSTDMEQKLMNYAKKYDYNFSHVSIAMAREHGIMFDSESCSRRWALLDLQEEFVFVDPDHPTIISPSRHEALFTPAVVNDTQQEDFTCPSTDKELAYFANRDGQRKTLDALMHNEVHPITSFNEALLYTSDISDDGMDIVHPPSETWLPSSMVSKAELPDMEDCDEDNEGIIHREELWRSMFDFSPRSVVFR